MEARKDDTPEAARQRREAARGDRAQELRVQRPRRRAGQRYRSAAVVPDGTPEPEFTATPSCTTTRPPGPGARLPHVWLGTTGSKVSTHDLAGKGRFSPAHRHRRRARGSRRPRPSTASSASRSPRTSSAPAASASTSTTTGPAPGRSRSPARARPARTGMSRGARRARRRPDGRAGRGDGTAPGPRRGGRRLLTSGTASPQEGATMGSDGIAVRETARPAAAGAVDVEADVVVVGGGGGGLPTALFSRWLGDDVVLLEKAPRARRHRPEGRLLVLGAAQRADARRSGIEDPEEDFLRYVRAAVAARVATTPTARRSGSPRGSTPRSARSTRARRPRPSCSASAARCPTGTARRCPTTGPSCPRTRPRPAACSCRSTPASRCPTAG